MYHSLHAFAKIQNNFRSEKNILLAVGLVTYFSHGEARGKICGN